MLLEKKDWINITDKLPKSEQYDLLECHAGKAYGNYRYICIGFYAKRYSVYPPPYTDFGIEYFEETDDYYLLEGWYETIKNCDDYSCLYINDVVTHWMPLPELPEQKDE